mgnify:CR=1 FL=1
MCKTCEDTINKIWQNIAQGQTYRMPDLNRGATFRVIDVNKEWIKISTQTAQNILKLKNAFISTIHYLKENKHYKYNSCEIRSSNDRNLSGPLCQTSRDNNYNVCCINYILPILFCNNIVGIDGNRLNKPWLF